MNQKDKSYGYKKLLWEKSTNCIYLILVMQHLKESRDPIKEEILHETEQMLARGRMDLPLSICFAAVRGDDLLLQQLLKRGSDPNEQDNSGRTALVCMSPLFITNMFILVCMCLAYIIRWVSFICSLTFFWFLCNSISPHPVEVTIV